MMRPGPSADTAVEYHCGSWRLLLVVKESVGRMSREAMFVDDPGREVLERRKEVVDRSGIAADMSRLL